MIAELKGSDSWDITTRSPVKVNRRFGVKFQLHSEGRRVIKVREQHGAGSKLKTDLCIVTAVRTSTPVLVQLSIRLARFKYSQSAISNQTGKPRYLLLSFREFLIWKKKKKKSVASTAVNPHLLRKAVMAFETSFVASSLFHYFVTFFVTLSIVYI
jgi:hypothetical protein